jgi:hypothetical protein
VSDAIQYLIADYKSTSQTVFVLFIIEIAVFLIYFYILPYLTNLIKTDGNIIQGDPVYLNKTTVIPATTIQPITIVNTTINTDENPDGSSNSVGLKNDIYNKYNYEGNVRKNFTISLWCYLNAPTASRIAPNTTGKTPAEDKKSIYGANIFYYGTPSSMDLDPINHTNNAPPFLDLSGGSYHPRLAYYVDLSDSYYVIDTNTDDANSRFELRLPMQRWNNFVFNYNANTVDIFINGTLERTVEYSGLPNFQYNTDIIESARKFFKIEREFKKIQEYTNVEESIKTNYDKLIQRTFDDIKKNYDKVNNTLKQIDKSVSVMKFVFYLLIIVNIFIMIYNSSEPLSRMLRRMLH